MKKVIFFIVVVFTTLSCDNNFLDRTPYDGFSDQNVWTSDEYAIMGLNGVYSSLTRSSMFYAPMYFSVVGPESFAYVRTWEGLEIAMGYATPAFDVFKNVYTNFYKTIRYTNDAVTNLEGNEQVSGDLAERLIGEAKFIRGLCYFYLTNLYGELIILDKPVLPSETYLPRSSVEDVREFIISDFTDAISKLPVSYEAGNEGRVTKGAAIAMLGKVYLYAGQWANAAEQFKKLMAAPYTYELTNDYFDNFNWKTQPNSETVYDLNYINEAGYGSGWDQFYGSRSHQTFAQDYVNPQLRNVQSYLRRDGSAVNWSTIPRLANYGSKYEYGLELMPWYQTNLSRETMDERLHKNYVMPGETLIGKGDKVYKLYYPYSSYLGATPAPNRTTFGDAALLTIRKLVTEGSTNTLTWDAPTNFPVIRFADVLLMYAEAKNEAEGPSAEVYDAMNRVRNRAKAVDLGSGLSQNALRKEIRLERYRELPCEGILYFDVKRWRVAHLSQAEEPYFSLNHTVCEYNGEPYYTGVFMEKDYLWPIPQTEMDLNSNIIQNEGWNY